MRIISGRARGRRLQSPRGKGTRPTSDRVREALFSMLGSIEGAVVLDGFAGTGALGLEAWSRGASQVYFAEPDRQAAAVVRQNIELLDAESDTHFLPLPFHRAITEIAEPLDLIFLDPPYNSNLAGEALAILSARPEILNDGARVVWESSTDTKELLPPGFTPWKSRTYGSTRVQILEAAVVDPRIP